MSILKDNSYHILGLDTSTNQKEISKRSKEIITRLKIDDVPSYDLDLDIFEGFRTEYSVKKAVEKLTSPKKQIEEYFFWFQVVDDIDEQAVNLFRNGEYDEAVRVWEQYSSDETTKALLYKKNLALLYSLLLYKDRKSQYLVKSVRAWKDLVDSEKFWSAFSKVYMLHDDLGADRGVVSDFRQRVADLISDIFADLSSRYSDQDFVSSFSNIFGMKGKRMETDIVDPIYKKINDVVEELDKMQVSADGTLDQQETNTIKAAIQVVQEELNTLSDLGLYDDSRTGLLRDRAAAALRKISIDLENNLSQTEVALGLAKVASQISGGAGLKGQMKQDLQTLESNRLINPVVSEIKSGNLDGALKLINKSLTDQSTPEDVRSFMQGLKDRIEEKQREAVGGGWGSTILPWVLWFGVILVLNAIFGNL